MPAAPMLGLLEEARHDWPLLVVGSLLALSALTTVHILLTRRESSSAVAWTGVVWTSPGIGPLLYLLLGINRVQRKAVRLLGRAPELPEHAPLPIEADLPEGYRHLPVLARAIGRITGERLLGGNDIDPLRNGDEAYPEMLAAIEGSQVSLSLLTYILDDDPWGRRFVQALIDAHRRGVAVRVLIDGFGARRAWAPVRTLRRAGVPTEVFLWSWAPWKMALINLRNHRKLLVADGRLAFTGGINVRQSYVHEDGPGTGCDLHFRVCGPLVRRLQRVFAVDWAFSTGEMLQGDEWYPPLVERGGTFARVIPDGPDEDLLEVATVLFQAVSLARDRILVITPYFLPPAALQAALGAAAQRGVDISVVLPENNEPRWMNRATMADVEELLEQGVRIGFKPGPFEHTKLTVVDHAWMLLGSPNWDPRSLRLNFELAVETYDPVLVEATVAKLRPVLRTVQWLQLDALRGHPVYSQVVDAAVRLFKPWL